MPRSHISPARVGLIGDVHGDAVFAIRAIEELSALGVTEMWQLGDWGLDIGGGSRAHYAYLEISAALELAGGELNLVEGNHERFDAWGPAKRGTRVADPTWPRIYRIGRGHRWRSEAGRIFAALGGAHSVDKPQQVAAGYWDPREQIDDDDLAALGTDHVDALLGHEAPTTTALEGRLARSSRLWQMDGLAWAAAGRAQYMRGFAAVTPQLTVSGHYHFPLDVTETHPSNDGVEFMSRSVILGMEFEALSVAILDTETLAIDRMTISSTPSPAETTADHDWIRAGLATRGWDISDLAQAIGESAAHLYQVLDGQAILLPTVRQKMTAVFGR